MTPVELPPRSANRLTIKIPGRLTGGSREAIADAIHDAVADNLDTTTRTMIQIRIEPDESWIVDISDSRYTPRDFSPVKGKIIAALAKLPRE